MAVGTHALHKKINFLAFVPFRQCQSRDTNLVQAGSMSAHQALEVYMVMVVHMILGLTYFLAHGILHRSLIIQYLVQNSLIQKCLQGPVDRHPVEPCIELAFQVTMRKGEVPVIEQIEYILPGFGMPEVVLLEHLGHACIHRLSCFRGYIPLYLLQIQRILELKLNQSAI